MLHLVRLIVIASCLLGPLAAPLAAQGTSGTLPGPITTGDLHKYAARLELSVPQRQAAESFHDQYKVRFDALRKGDISRFLKDMAKLQGDSAGGLPPREAVVDFLQERKKLLSRISTLDRRLLADMKVVLTEEQSDLLPRIDLWRRRDKVMAAGMGFLNLAGPTIDLVEIISSLDSETTSSEEADKILTSWEYATTKKLELVQRATDELILTMIDRLAEMGYDQEAAVADPEMMRSVMTVMDEVTSSNQEIAGEITKRTLRSARQIADAMEEGGGRVFLQTFYRRAYPASTFAMATMDRPIAILLGRDDLTDEQRTAISDAHATLTSELSLVLEKAVTAIQDRNEATSILGAFQGQPTGHGDPLAPLQEQAAVARATATAVLNEALDIELVAASIDEAQAEAAAEHDAVVYEQGDIRVMRQHMAPASFSTMGEEDARSMKRLLAITPQQHDIFDAAFDSYREEMLLALRDVDDADRPGVIDDRDSRFLADLQAILSEEQRQELGRIREMRDRQRATVGLDFGYLDGSNEANVDLPLLLYRSQLLEDHHRGVLEAIEPFESSLTEAFEDRQEMIATLRDGARAFNVSLNLSEVAEEDQLSVAAAAQVRWRQEAQTYRDQLAELRSQISALNDQMLESIEGNVPEEVAGTVEAIYLEYAFPHLFRDSGSVVEPLHRARQLDDLTIDQAQSLEDLATGYPLQWESATMAMISHERGRHRISSLEISGDPEYWQEYQARQQEISRHRFERDELNLRAKTRLREVLSAQQLAAIGVPLDDS